MRRLLLYALFVLLVLATAGPLLLLAFIEATRVMGDHFGDRLLAGIFIATTLLSVLGAIASVFLARKWYRPPRKQFRYAEVKRKPSTTEFDLHSSAADVDLDSLQAEYTLQNFPTSPRTERRPKEFTERLVGYLHRDPGELTEPRAYAPSKMSFWSRVGQLRWFGPKPAWIMRRLLERIREQVRGRAH